MPLTPYVGHSSATPKHFHDRPRVACSCIYSSHQIICRAFAPSPIARLARSVCHALPEGRTIVVVDGTNLACIAARDRRFDTTSLIKTLSANHQAESPSIVRGASHCYDGVLPNGVELSSAFAAWLRFLKAHTGAHSGYCIFDRKSGKRNSIRRRAVPSYLSRRRQRQGRALPNPGPQSRQAPQHAAGLSLNSSREASDADAVDGTRISWPPASADGAASTAADEAGTGTRQSNDFSGCKPSFLDHNGNQALAAVAEGLGFTPLTADFGYEADDMIGAVVGILRNSNHLAADQHRPNADASMATPGTSAQASCNSANDGQQGHSDGGGGGSDLRIVVVSGDTDMQQLLAPNVWWLQIKPFISRTHPTGQRSTHFMTACFRHHYH